MMIKFLLFVFPRRTYTAILGRFVRTRWSARWIPWYVRKFNIDATELDCGLTEYETLGQFFSRKLSSLARPIAQDGIASPVDGTVSMFGQVFQDTLFQIKGKSYSLAKLLGDAGHPKAYEGGTYITLYLSPRDYHRIHAPLDCTAVCCRHIPGTLFPVNRSGVTHIRDLFIQNERTVTEFQSESTTFALVKVGAAGVGTVVHPLLPERSWRERGHGAIVTHRVSKDYRKGDEIGYFALGSTVVLLFPRECNVVLTIDQGDKVRMGQCIGDFSSQMNQQDFVN